MKIREKDLGRYCTVRFDDIGKVEAVLFDSTAYDGEWRVFIFTDNATQRVSSEQILELGEKIRPAKK